jgi:hypothetical protein
MKEIFTSKKIKELKLEIERKDKEIAELKELNEQLNENFHAAKTAKHQANLQLKDSVRKDFCLQAIAAAAGHYKDGNVF